MNILISGDHAGVGLKAELVKKFKEEGHNVADLGPYTDESVDYPDYAKKLCEELDADSFGILICGTGIGVSIAANKMPGVRAALCKTQIEAELARQHNDANVLCLGARAVTNEVNERIARVFLNTEFEGGRHQVRVDKIMALEDPDNV